MPVSAEVSNLLRARSQVMGPEGGKAASPQQRPGHQEQSAQSPNQDSHGFEIPGKNMAGLSKLSNPHGELDLIVTLDLVRMGPSPLQKPIDLEMPHPTLFYSLLLQAHLHKPHAWNKNHGAPLHPKLMCAFSSSEL